MLLLFLIFINGVSAESQTVSVMEGDSVTLNSDLTEIVNKDTILWMFGPEDSLIAQIGRTDDLTKFLVPDVVAFRGRVQVNKDTGSLTIRNTRIRHSGQYKLTISREQTRIKIFNVTVQFVDGETDGVKSESVSVTEGQSVTLHADSEAHKDALMLWRFGDKGILLAKIDLETNHTSLNEDDERFKDRLELDNQTGSLTITNTRTEHAGLYEVQMRGSESSQRFLLSVNAVTDPGLSPGAIAGICVVGIVVVLLLVAVVIYYRRTISKLQHIEVKISAMEGDSPTLYTGLTEPHDENIQWWYEDETNLIAEVSEEKSGTHDGADGRFRSKLRLYDSGNLTISNIRTIHSGHYILKISSNRRTEYKRVFLTVDVKKERVTVGGSVLLENDAEIQTDSLLLWTFGAENSLVATNATSKDKTDERFTDRVELDEDSGSLRVSNIRSTDSGHYKLQIINGEQTTFRRFNVTVTESSGKTVNDSVTEMDPLLKEENVNGESHQTSSL
ncbi:hypothetical protein DPX16_4733 [Anabarilius grahami]|uniref:Immunoglobulin domain-containing protein n=1 Tax=Anabarilius grahami TaxID=495550 RepID=A0A3N0YGK8_ANAGA|nr:hypothetical protein DPX16_4733 [Anabarilius grahami]